VKNRHFSIYLNLLLRTAIIILLFSSLFFLVEAATNDWIDKSHGLSGKYASALAINPKNYNVIYVAMYEEGVFKSIDAGQTWLPINNGLLISSDGGKNWRESSLKSERTGNLPSVKSLIINPSHPQEIYAATGVGIYHSSDRGEKWEEIKPQKRLLFWTSNDLAIDFSDPVSIYSAANGLRDKPGGFVWKYTF